MTLQADFTSQDFLRNPIAEIERLRASGAVVEVSLPLIGSIWLTTTQELADQVLKDSETFTLRLEGGELAGVPWWMPRIMLLLVNNILTMDGPDHARLRQIADEGFRRALPAIEPRIATIAAALADELFADGSPADVVDRYARNVPLAVICELLGLPSTDRPQFMRRANKLTTYSGALGMLGLIPGLRAMRRYLERRMDAVHRDGGDGLLAEFVRAEQAGGGISRDEIVSMVFLLLFAGHESAMHLISGSVYELVRKPESRDWLQADWSRGRVAVEEFLRFVTPVQFTKPRFVRRDVELSGVQLRRGDRILAMLMAADMDPHANSQPEALDLQRRPNRHLAFGAGIHHCLGHQLARLQGRCALEALFKRWPKLELAIPESDVQWRKRFGLRAIDRLPVVAERR